MFYNVRYFPSFFMFKFDVRSVTGKAHSHSVLAFSYVLFTFAFATEQKINKIFSKAGEVVPYFESFFCYVTSKGSLFHEVLPA